MKATRQSSSAFSSGSERVIAAASPPSGSSHLAFGFSPASASSSFSGTPVYMTLWIMPWVNWQPLSWAPRHSMPLLAAHSRKWMRLTRGKRSRSSSVKTSGFSTSPWIISRHFAGSTSAMPPWWRSKQRPFGVMMPSSSCSGVKFTELTGSAVSQATLRRLTCASWGEG